MNLANVMQAIADQADTIAGLRVFGYPQPKVDPPAAIVPYPDHIALDETYQRGSDRITIQLVVLVGKATERTTRERVGAFCDGSGASSIKAVLEAGTYDEFDELVVTGVDFEDYVIAATTYLAAIFSIDILGPGA